MTTSRSQDFCEFTILIPCLDEERTVGTCVQKALGYMESRGLNGEVLIADNGSSDGSVEIAENAGARVVEVKETGYGSALRGGIRAARGRFVIMGDADDSYDFSDLDGFVARLRAGDDLVMGNRFLGGIRPGAMPILHRYLGNPLFTALGRLFFRSPVKDFYCGLRGFRKRSIQELGLEASGMEFAIEMVVKATLQGLTISEVPTVLSPDGRLSAPHLRRWRDGWRTLRFLLLFSPNWLFLYPGMTLFAAGLVWMTALLGGPLRFGSVSLDVNTLVYSGAAIVIGFQLIAFAALAKAFATRSGLLPPDDSTEWLRKLFRLEPGILAGGALATAGLIVSAYALWFWSEASFGPLNTRTSLRIVVPAATALILGMQIAFSSFFMSLLNLPTRL